MKLLCDKVVVVTGGAGLLGREFARSIMAQGGTAIVADVDEARGLKLVQELKASPGGQGSFIKMDITSRSGLDTALDSLVRQYGSIDALVNNAYPKNAHYGRKFEDVDYADFCENVNLHLGGYFLATQRFAEYFRRRGRGVVISIASVYGFTAPRFSVYAGTTMTMPVEYAAIKAAIIHLTKYWASYYRGTGVRFNCISPGGIQAGQPAEFMKKYKAFTASKGMLDNTDVAGTLVYLLSDLAACVNGQNLVVDDAFSL